MSEPAKRLPRWARAVFWSVVAFEWIVVAGVSATIAVEVYSMGRYLSCADADTVFAAGYSDKGWGHVAEGQSESIVRAVLGEPLFVWRADGVWWSYSTHGRMTDDYLERKIRFDAAGRVVEKHEECYID